MIFKHIFSLPTTRIFATLLLLASLFTLSCDDDNPETPTYTVTFNSQGGTEVVAQSVKQGDKAKEPTAPTRDKYLFQGWYLEAAGTTRFDFSTKTITANITLYAKWVSNEITVTFDTGLGTVVPPQTIAGGAPATRPTTNPTRNGFTFIDWFIDLNEGDTPFDFNTTLTENTTLYARWGGTVSFSVGEGSAVPAQTVAVGRLLTRPADNPTRTDYVFVDWYADREFMNLFNFMLPITKKTTLYARWRSSSATTRQVTFNVGVSGLTVSPQTVEVGTPASRPIDPPREGYILLDWYEESTFQTVFDFNTPITTNRTLYAQWGHRVVFDSRGGGPVPAQTVLNNGTLTRPDNPKTSGIYALALAPMFLDWYTTPSLQTVFDFNTPITANRTLYAKWAYKVRFLIYRTGKATYGEPFALASVNEGEMAVMPTEPTREKGYLFDNWYSDLTYTRVFDFNTPITTSVDVYGKWLVTYPVIFDSGEGTDVADLEVGKGRMATAPPNPTRSNYTFDGWYQDLDSPTPYSFMTTAVQSPLTLYAKWRGTGTNTVSFNTNRMGGPTVDAQTVTTGATADRPADPSVTGQAFIGWYTAQDGNPEARYDFNKEVTQDITLYAKWDDASNYTFVSATNTLTLVRNPSNNPVIELPSSISGVPVRVLQSAVAEANLFVTTASSSYTTAMYVVVPYSVTEIGSYAFSSCGNLAGITMETNQLAEVGDYAFFNSGALESVVLRGPFTRIRAATFSGCGSLKKVVLPDAVTHIEANAFYSCSSLGIISDGDFDTFTLPSSLESIGEEAYYGCASLAGRLDIPAGVTSIAPRAFARCAGFSAISVPGGLSRIEKGVFSYCVNARELTVSEGVTEFADSAFYQCASLGIDLISLPTSLRRIGDYAFAYSKGMPSLTLPEGLEHIGKFAFDQCNSLGSVATGGVLVLPSTLKTMGEGGFQGCTALSSLVIPGSLSIIPDAAFASCPSLQTLVIEEGVTSIGAQAFSLCSSLGGPSIDDRFKDLSNTLTLPSSLRTIGDFAFSGCSTLRVLTIPEGVTSIGASSFFRCGSLGTLTLPSSLESIGENAFIGGYSLGNDTNHIITLPAGLTSIGAKAFSFPDPVRKPEDIKARLRLVIEATTPPTLGDDALGVNTTYHPNLKIQVPFGTVDAYKAAPGWQAHAAIIE